MSYSLKRRKFKCLNCKTAFTKLVSVDDMNVNCDNCGKLGHEENKKEEDSLPNRSANERKRQQLVDSAYRIVFNQNNSNQFHTKTNIRDRSIENIHGDANFDTDAEQHQYAKYCRDLSKVEILNECSDGVPPLETIYRTPNPQKNKFSTVNNGININRQRPPSASRGGNFQNYQSTSQTAHSNQASTSTLPRINSRQSSRPSNLNHQQQFNNTGRPPSGMFMRSNLQSRGGRPPNVQQQHQQESTIPSYDSHVFSNGQSAFTRVNMGNSNNNGGGGNMNGGVGSTGFGIRMSQKQQQQQSNGTVGGPTGSGFPLRRDANNGQANGAQQQSQRQAQQEEQRQPRMASQGPRMTFQSQESGANNNDSQQQRGPRARSTTIRTSDGRVIQLIQMPMGELGNLNSFSYGNSTTGQAAAPQVFFMRRNGGGPSSGGPPGMNLAGLASMGGANPFGQQDQRIEQMISSMLRSFQDLFSGHEFLRMNTMFTGFSPDMFMSNFNSNFTSDVDFFEMARRMSEQEAEARAHKNRAKKDSVSKLPIVKIEQKHCKKNQQSGEFEAPTCTVCCENIAIGMKGMFMPCGHIYHPDCLNPWLKEHNTCPVCRFELPTEEA